MHGVDGNAPRGRDGQVEAIRALKVHASWQGAPVRLPPAVRRRIAPGHLRRSARGRKSLTATAHLSPAAEYAGSGSGHRMAARSPRNSPAGLAPRPHRSRSKDIEAGASEVT